MTRTEILNAIARTIGARRYVEIGVRNPGDNFDLIQVAEKVGVDPVAARPDILAMTSDAYFASNPAPADLYFIDGLHTAEQAGRDFANAGLCLSPGGVIVLHDCLPQSTAAMGPIKPAGGGPWNGTVWQSWLAIRRMHAWESHCIFEDHGCGVAWRAPNTYILETGPVTAEQYLANPFKYARPGSAGGIVPLLGELP